MGFGLRRRRAVNWAGTGLEYIVEDGGHVFSGQCYAEIEVRVVIGLLGHGREGRKRVGWSGLDRTQE